ncbi:YheT family hydrolase [Namhaeicola litoreus]|uniref:YheT family hydrolase n=1 Tax=Namhaeicola litoreus TaxID=1052145 RepID=A0ABW3Y4J4_9FLAO
MIINTTYQPERYFRNGHLNTVFRTLAHQLQLNYTRERINTPDGDFLDLDWVVRENEDLIVMIHGLEGSAQSKYIISLGTKAIEKKFDVLAMNLRGCSGELNRLYKSYHSGETEDLQYVLKDIISSKKYKRIFLVGYSLGGNQVLKYLGETQKYNPICKAVAVSVPCDLHASSVEISKPKNFIYLYRFLNSLKPKLIKKNEVHYPEFSETIVKEIKNFSDFDNLYTAPAHGFKNAVDYYQQASSKPFIPFIKKNTLIISALDDPFLSKSCFPFEEANKNDFVYLEVPSFGGHVGFNVQLNYKKDYWLENRILHFFRSN